MIKMNMLLPLMTFCVLSMGVTVENGAASVNAGPVAFWFMMSITACCTAAVAAERAF